MAKKGVPWFEDEVFWETVGPILFSRDRIQNAAQETQDIIELLKIRKGSTILDLCCGVGRHSIEFASRGYIVTAVDRTEKYLRSAKRKARRKGVHIEFVRGDMREFYRANSFNAILSMYTSFGYFKNQEDDYRVARNMYTSLKKGGKVIIEMMGKEILARIFLPRGWREIGNRIILEERKMSEDWSMISNRWIVIQGRKRREFRLTHRIYSATELGNLLRSCGFSIDGVYGTLDGAPYGPRANRLIMVAKKGRR
jgi:SAM-dependent methyltransferase